MGGYQSVLNGLYYHTTFVAIHRRISTLAQCNHRKTPIINNVPFPRRFSPSNTLQNASIVYPRKDGTFPSKIALVSSLHLSRSPSTNINREKNVKNRSISNKSATGSARATRRSPNDTHFASPINYLRTGVDPMSIRPVVPEI